MTSIRTSVPASPTEKESSLARQAGRRLGRYGRRDLKITLGGTGEAILLPASAVRMLNQALSEMASGNAVTLVPAHAELTTQQAAELVGVSRPFLITQMRQGLLPFRKVGTHRRVLLKDVMEYKRKIDAARLDVLDELAAQAQELKLGY